MLGEDVISGIPGFKSMADFMHEDLETEIGLNRCWFYPVRFGAEDIRTSPEGDVVLFDTKLQVLTEAMAVSEGGMTGLARASPIVEKASDLFTEHLAELEQSVTWNDQPVFKQLHALLDVTTLATLWRFAPESTLLKKLGALPVPKRDVPRFYKGLVHEVGRRAEGNNIRVLAIGGGVHMDRRVSHRNLDGYEDGALRELRRQADKLTSGASSVTATGLTLLVSQTPVNKTEVAEQQVAKGLKLLAANDISGAIDAFSRAIGTTPDLVEAYAFRGSAEASLKQFAAAKSDFATARELAPEDKQIQAAQLSVEIETGATGPFENYEYRVRLAARERYKLQGDRAMASQQFKEATDWFGKALLVNKDLEQAGTLELLVRRGSALESLKDYTAASTDYSEAGHVYENIAHFDMFTAEAVRDTYRQLQLGKGRIEVLTGQYDRALSDNSAFSSIAQDPDPVFRLEAKYQWAVMKALALKEKRQERLSEGLGISRSWSTLEAAKLRESARELQQEVSAIGARRQTNRQLADLADMSRDLIKILDDRSRQIQNIELNGN